MRGSREKCINIGEAQDVVGPLLGVSSRAPLVGCWHLWWGALAVLMIFVAKTPFLQ